MSLKSISSGELIALAERNNLPLVGILLNNDESYGNIKWRRGFYIINLAPRPPGTHWVCLFITKGAALYFDSFGVIPDDRLISALQKDGYQIAFNSYAIQSLRSEACGYFCLFFMLYLNRSSNEVADYEKFINLFTPYARKNEVLLERLLQTTLK